MTSPHEQLAEFERVKLGADVPRQNGKIEKGHGSKFAGLSPEDRAQHAALEKQIEVEAELDRAQAHLDAMHAARAAHHDLAVERAQGALDAAVAKRKAAERPAEKPAPRPEPESETFIPARRRRTEEQREAEFD